MMIGREIEGGKIEARCNGHQMMMATAGPDATTFFL